MVRFTIVRDAGMVWDSAIFSPAPIPRFARVLRPIWQVYSERLPTLASKIKVTHTSSRPAASLCAWWRVLRTSKIPENFYSQFGPDFVSDGTSPHQENAKISFREIADMGMEECFEMLLLSIISSKRVKSSFLTGLHRVQVEWMVFH